MKRIISMVMALMMIMTTAAMAEETKLEVMPVLISAEVKAFEIVHDGTETFTIVVSENASTGYLWNYTINKDTHVEFVNEEIIPADNGMVGAPSEKRMTFKVLGEGVSTILFENKRDFGDQDVAEAFTILAYQNGDKIFIEEDQMVYTMDTAVPTLYDGVPTLYDGVPTLYTVGETATYNGETIEADVAIQKVDGVTMVPLRATLEAMGYTVTWNNETKSVEISKGAQWTSVTVGKNYYFKNRMAPVELSAAPVIVDNRTLVPVEFFTAMLGKGITVDSQNINFSDFESPIHSGYVKEIRTDETGTVSYTLTSDYESDSIELQVIIHTSDAFTFVQRDVKEGDFVNVVSSMIMTMSIPGQTSGYVIY